MPSDRFELWLERAREGRLETWRLILGFALALGGSLALQGVVVVGVLVAMAGPQAEGAPMELGLSRLGGGALMLCSFAAFWLVTPIVRRALHGLKLSSLIGWDGRFNGRAFLAAAAAGLLARIAASGLLTLLGFGAEAPADAQTAMQPGGVSLIVLLALIPLTFIQVGAEELLFRGYITQSLAARARARVWLWAVVPNALFGAIHYIAGAPWDVIAIQIGFAMCFGLIATGLVRIEGGLGAAIGFHFVNNYFMFILLVATGAELSPQAAIDASGSNSWATAIAMGVYFLIFIEIIRARWLPFGRWIGLRP